MKESLRVFFVDFWPQFQLENNFIINTLKLRYDVILDEKRPQFIFFSVFGQKNLKYFKSCRIFFSGENQPLDKFSFDYSISWHYRDQKNHYRLPLFKVHLAERPELKKKLNAETQRELLRKIWRSKSKFCCIVVSNPSCNDRNKVFLELSKFEKIDSGGKLYNNVGGPVESKDAFISDYKFVISFENSAESGYTTEKIIEPIIKNSIPIYWGNIEISNDFNPNRFIHYKKDSMDVAKLYTKMKTIESDEELALDILQESIFLTDPYIVEAGSSFSNFLSDIVKQGIVIKPRQRRINQLLILLNVKLRPVKKKMVDFF